MAANPPAHRRPESWWVPTAFLKGNPIFSVKLEKHVFPVLSSDHWFLSSEKEWSLFADSGSISSFAIHWKEAGSATELFSSWDLFVLSAHLEASKCCVSIIGTGCSKLSVASLTGACLSTQLYFVSIKLPQLVQALFIYFLIYLFLDIFKGYGN